MTMLCCVLSHQFISADFSVVSFPFFENMKLSKLKKLKLKLHFFLALTLSQKSNPPPLIPYIQGNTRLSPVGTHRRASKFPEPERRNKRGKRASSLHLHLHLSLHQNKRPSFFFLSSSPTINPSTLSLRLLLTSSPWLTLSKQRVTRPLPPKISTLLRKDSREALRGLTSCG